MMTASTEVVEKASCRNCGREFIGKPYRFGGGAWFPKTMEAVPVNYFGGYVCSRGCDVQVCLNMLSSMPGAGRATSLDSGCETSVARNWS